MTELRVGAATDIGRKRSQNQDSFASLPELGLFVVADGMGGHKGGEIASAMAVENIASEIRQAAVQSPKTALAEAISKANEAIFERSTQEPQLRGMGTTVTALFFKNGTLTIGHVGDSRCYFYRDGAIWQLTRDHSLVQEKFRAGLITREGAKTDTMKNVITRSVGYEPKLQVEVYEMHYSPGDSFLICSDGLSGLVEDPEICKTLTEKLGLGEPPEKIVHKLIADANTHGGDDNITGVLICVA